MQEMSEMNQKKEGNVYVHVNANGEKINLCRLPPAHAKRWKEKRERINSLSLKTLFYCE